MCATCGCGTSHHHDEHEHLREQGHSHGHSHAHGDAHEHTHEHGGVVHSHPRRIPIEEEILAKNDRAAARNRAWLGERKILSLNVMSAPGAGKTTLLEQTIRRLGIEFAISVIEGDQETERDAERIRATGCAVRQINTGAGCHLDAEMVDAALRSLDPPRHSLMLIENVGNLVCPALFDLGEHARVVILSVTEGEDKPLKYPHMFRAADVLLLGKIDLLPHVDFDVEQCLDNVRLVNPRLRIFPVSARRSYGIDAWCDWLRSEIGAVAGVGARANEDAVLEGA